MQMANGKWQVANGRWQMADSGLIAICPFTSFTSLAPFAHLPHLPICPFAPFAHLVEIGMLLLDAPLVSAGEVTFLNRRCCNGSALMALATQTGA